VIFFRFIVIMTVAAFFVAAVMFLFVNAICWAFFDDFSMMNRIFVTIGLTFLAFLNAERK